VLLARIQGHPARSHLHQPLADSLGLPTEVFLHASDPPSPWDGYKQCLRDLPDGHVLIVQDDVEVASNFAPAVERIAASNPDMPVVLFLAKLPQRVATQALRASLRKECYVAINFRQMEFCPVVAVLWPTQIARSFLDWTEQNPHRLGHPAPRSDDGVMGRWAAFAQQTIRFTVPSIVEHPDREASLIGRRAMWGKDKGRCALLLAADASDYNW